MVVGWQVGWRRSGLSSRKVGPAHRCGTHLSRLGGRLPTEWERHRGRPRVWFAVWCGVAWEKRSYTTEMAESFDRIACLCIGAVDD